MAGFLMPAQPPQQSKKAPARGGAHLISRACIQGGGAAAASVNSGPKKGSAGAGVEGERASGSSRKEGQSQSVAWKKLRAERGRLCDQLPTPWSVALSKVALARPHIFLIQRRPVHGLRHRCAFPGLLLARSLASLAPGAPAQPVEAAQGRSASGQGRRDSRRRRGRESAGGWPGRGCWGVGSESLGTSGGGELSRRGPPLAGFSAFRCRPGELFDSGQARVRAQCFTGFHWSTGCWPKARHCRAAGGGGLSAGPRWWPRAGPRAQGMTGAGVRLKASEKAQRKPGSRGKCRGRRACFDAPGGGARAFRAVES